MKSGTTRTGTGPDFTLEAGHNRAVAGERKDTGYISKRWYGWISSTSRTGLPGWNAQDNVEDHAGNAQSDNTY
jgi:hypothetical protein